MLWSLPATRPTNPSRPRTRLGLEPLEAREVPATVTAGLGSEAVALDSAVTSAGSAVSALDFTITDGGGDGAATGVYQFVVRTNTSTADPSKVTWVLNGPDVTNVTGTYNAGTQAITFAGGISVADTLSETYTVTAFYNDPTGLTEGQVFNLSVNAADFTVDPAGTQMDGSQADVTNGAGMTVSVTATELRFGTQPASSVSGQALGTQPVVRATDANGNVDTGFAGTVSLTTAAPGFLSGTTGLAAVAGVATFTDVAYTATADQESFQLTGSAGGLTGATSNSVGADVVATRLIFGTQPAPTGIQSGAATPFTTVPVVYAADANGTLDTGYATPFVLSVTDPNDGTVDGTVDSLTGTGDTDGSGTTVTLSPVGGSATFTGLSITYTNAGSSNILALQAASGGLSAANSVSITALINNAPTVAGLDTNSVAWAGVGNVVALDAAANATVADAEFDALNGGSGDYAGATLTVRRSGTAVTSDGFGFDLTGASFTVNGSSLEAGGLTFATFTQTGGVLTVNFTSTGTAATTALVQDVLRRVTYRNDTPAGNAGVAFDLSDGFGSATGAVTVTSDIIYVNDTGDASDADRNTVSLREAADIAAGQVGAQTIRFAASAFAAPQTITLGSTLTLEGGLTIDSSAAAGVTVTGGSVSLGGTVTYVVGTGDSDTIASDVTGSGGLTKQGAGTLTLSSNSNTYSGATAVTAGTLAARSLGSTFSLTVDGGTLAASTSLNVPVTLTIGNGGATIDLSTGSVNLSDISGIAGLTVTSTAPGNVLSTSADNSGTFSGTTTLNDGILQFGSDAAYGTGTIVVNGGRVRAQGATARTIANALSLGGTLTMSGSAALTFTGAVDLTGGNRTVNNSIASDLTFSGAVGNGDLTISNQGAGAVVLGGTNIHGTTTLSAGVLSVTDDTNLGTGAVALAAGTTLTVTGTGVTIDNAVALTGAATISHLNDLTLSGALSGGAFALTKGGAGRLTLTNTANEAGLTGGLIAQGNISVADDDALPAGVITLSGGWLFVTGTTTINNDIVLASGTNVIDVTLGQTATLTGTLSGSGTQNINKSSGGTLVFAGIATHTGNTVLNGGTVSVSSDTNVGNGLIILNNSTPTLALTGALSREIDVNKTSNISVVVPVTFSGVLSGTAALTKTGVGAITLSGTSTHTGALTVADGAVLVTGTLTSSAVAVSTGATLGGTGTVSGPVTAAGTVAPGTGGAGVLTLAGGLTFTAGGALALDLNGSVPGTDFDRLVTPTLTLAGTTLAGALGFVPTAGDSFVFIDNSGAPVAGTFAGLPEGALVSIGGATFALTYVGGDGNDVALTALPTPTVSVADVTVAEGQSGTTALTFVVRLSGPSAVPVTVDYATAAGTAASGSDFAPASGTLTFDPGVTELTVTVGVVADTVQEADETFTLVLSNTTGATVARGTATGTVTNDDAAPTVVVGIGVSGSSGGTIQSVNPTTGELGAPLPVYSGFAGDVRVAAGDVDGDGTTDMITGAGAGAPGGHVKVFDGRTGAERFSFLAFEGFAGGVNVTAGDIDGDGTEDIIVSADAGAAPHVKVFSGRDGSLLRSFLAYDAGFLGGVRVAAADVDGDGLDDIVTASGPGTAPHVKVFSGRDGALLRSFLASGSAAGGLFVAAGDLDGDGRAEVVTGAGPGGAPTVTVYSGRDGTTLRTFGAFDDGFVGGVRVGVAELNGRQVILTGAGPGAGPHLKAFALDGTDPLVSLLAGSADLRGGVYVG